MDDVWPPGGFLCQSEELWRVIFYIQGGLAAVFFVLGVMTIPADGGRAKYTKGIDWVGAALSVVGVGMLTFVLSYVSLLLSHLHPSLTLAQGVHRYT